jgi:hypothetical protein
MTYTVPWRTDFRSFSHKRLLEWLKEEMTGFGSAEVILWAVRCRKTSGRELMLAAVDRRHFNVMFYSMASPQRQLLWNVLTVEPVTVEPVTLDSEGLVFVSAVVEFVRPPRRKRVLNRAIRHTARAFHRRRLATNWMMVREVKLQAQMRDLCETFVKPNPTHATKHKLYI